MCDYPIETGGAIKHRLPSLSSWNQQYLLFCKLQCFFTLYESGEGSGLRSWNCAASIVAYKRDRKYVILHTAVLFDCIAMKSIPEHSVVANVPRNYIFISYNSQTCGMWKDCSLNVHYKLTWQNMSTQPFLKKLPVLCYSFSVRMVVIMTES